MAKGDNIKRLIEHYIKQDCDHCTDEYARNCPIGRPIEYEQATICAWVQELDSGCY